MNEELPPDASIDENTTSIDLNFIVECVQSIEFKDGISQSVVDASIHHLEVLWNLRYYDCIDVKEISHWISTVLEYAQHMIQHNLLSRLKDVFKGTQFTSENDVDVSHFQEICLGLMANIVTVNRNGHEWISKDVSFVNDLFQIIFETADSFVLSELFRLINAHLSYSIDSESPWIQIVLTREDVVEQLLFILKYTAHRDLYSRSSLFFATIIWNKDVFDRLHKFDFVKTIMEVIALKSEDDMYNNTNATRILEFYSTQELDENTQQEMSQFLVLLVSKYQEDPDILFSIVISLSNLHYRKPLPWNDLLYTMVHRFIGFEEDKEVVLSSWILLDALLLYAIETGLQKEHLQMHRGTYETKAIQHSALLDTEHFQTLLLNFLRVSS